MTKTIIPIIGVTTIIAFNSFIGADEPVKKAPLIPLLVNAGPIVSPIPRPTKGEFCTRVEYPVSGPFPITTVSEVIDGPVPLHCLEPNCGLGVYSKRENEDLIERCSYCNAVKPENLN